VSLERQQREFIDAVLARDTPADDRLAIYHRSALANRRGALAAAYPVVARLVGGAFFDEAAACYAEAFPSRSGDLNAFGDRLAAFLEAYPYARELPYLPDVARLEWAVHESRHSPRGEALDYLALGAVQPEALGEIRIRPRPSVRLVASRHPILSIWAANQAGRDGTPERTRGAEQVAVRLLETLESIPVALGRAEWVVLEAFMRGDTLAHAAAACGAVGLDFEPALASLAKLDVLGGFEATKR
jgi:hypothetical protein